VNPSRIFIQRPIMTVLVMVFLFFMGVLGYWKLPINDMPNVDFPAITVSTMYPGASPETIATIVTTPLEKQFMQIPGLTSVSSKNTLGNSQIVLNFDLSRNLDGAALDVQAAITQAQAYLPPNLPYPPIFQKFNPSDTPILDIVMMSDSVDLSEIYRYGFTLVAQRLSMVDGVAQVLVQGQPYAARVGVDPYLVSTMDLSWDYLAGQVAGSTPDLPTGQLDGLNRSWIVDSDANLQTAEAFNPIILRWQDGTPTRFDEVGESVASVQNTRFGVKYYDEDHKEGIPAIILSVLRQPGSNTVKLSSIIKSELPSLMDKLPASIKLKVMYDKAETIKSSIGEVEETLIIAIILVTLVIFIYLGSPTDTLIPTLAMPMSIMMTFWFMELFGFTIDNLSLLALILATGFIIDDAVVVLENIVHHMEKGMKRWQAAVEGSRQIGFTIVSMTLSLAAVFIPLVYMSGIIGRLFFEFSIVLVTVILCSGFISLTLTPMLCSRILSLKKAGKKKNFSDYLNENFNRIYEKSLHRWVPFRKTILAIGILNVVLTCFLFYVLPKGFLPDDDIGYIQGFTVADEGASPTQMSMLQDQVADALKHDSNIVSMMSTYGTPQVNQGLLSIYLVPFKERTVKNTLTYFMNMLRETPGINTYLKNIPLINLDIGSSSRGAYQYTLQGWNKRDVYTSAAKMFEQLKKMEQLQGVNSDMQINAPQVKFNILREQAASLGVTAQEIQQTLLYAYSGNRVARINTPYDQYDVIIEVPEAQKKIVDDLRALWVSSINTNGLIPLSAVADWKIGSGPSQVNHINQLPAVTFAFNLAHGAALNTTLKKIDEISKTTVDKGIFASVRGAAQTFQESVSSLGILFVFSIVAIYIILGILYESFIHPLTILSSLPPAILGGLLTLWIFDMPLDLYSYLGLILLIGIVKKNGILVVDFALQNKREKHEDPYHAIIDACVVRFRPIMMTTFAAIMGAVPIMFASGPGAVGRRPLGYVIVGGLLLSQLITLYLTPVIYLYMDKWNDKFAMATGEEVEGGQHA